MKIQAILLGTLVFGLLGCGMAAAGEPDTDAVDLPKVLVIATGGTIAGVQEDPTDPDLYRAGSLSAEQILASVPELKRHARIESEQFSNLASSLQFIQADAALRRGPFEETSGTVIGSCAPS